MASVGSTTLDLPALFTREYTPDLYSKEEKVEAEEALFEVYRLLNSDNGSEVSLEELLAQADVTMQAHLRGLSFSSVGNGVMQQRKPSECWISSYNPDILRVWQANMDLQFILDPLCLCDVHCILHAKE